MTKRLLFKTARRGRAGEYVSVEEAAEAVDRSKQWVRDKVKTGEIRAKQGTRRAWLVSLTDARAMTSPIQPLSDADPETDYVTLPPSLFGEERTSLIGTPPPPTVQIKDAILLRRVRYVVAGAIEHRIFDKVEAFDQIAELVASLKK